MAPPGAAEPDAANLGAAAAHRSPWPRLLAVGAVGAVYLAVTHWLMTGAAASPWNAVGVLAPMLAGAAWAAGRAGQAVRCAVALASMAWLVVQAARGVALPAPQLYLAQHVGVHLALALGFAATLQRSAQPLISRLAAKLHGKLSPAIAAYTRNVTRAWVGYFVVMAAASVLIFATAPFDAWALFANVLTPLAVALMFAGEWLLRYRLHPEFKRTRLIDAVRVFVFDAEPPVDAPPR